MSTRHRRTAAILLWLGREAELEDNNIESTLERLLQPLPSGKSRDQAKGLLTTAINLYHYPCGTQSPHKSCQQEDVCVKGVSDLFSQEFVASEIPGWCMDIILEQPVFFSCLIEDQSKESALTMALPVLRAVVELLLAQRSETPEKKTSIDYICRKGRKMKKCMLLCEPATLKHLNSAPATDRKMFLCKVFLSDERMLTVNNPMLYGCAKFWCNFCDVTRTELTAILMAFTNPKKIVEERTRVPNKTAKFDVSMVHAFSCFQQIAEFGNILNELLDCSFPKLLFSKLSFLGLYRAVTRFITTEQMLQDYGNAEGVLDLMTKIESELPKKLIETRSRRRKRDKSRDETASKMNAVSKPSHSSNPSDEDSTEGQHGLLGDINNRFSILSVE